MANWPTGFWQARIDEWVHFVTLRVAVNARFSFALGGYSYRTAALSEVLVNVHGGEHEPLERRSVRRSRHLP
jgi:hypothetical protein